LDTKSVLNSSLLQFPSKRYPWLRLIAVIADGLKLLDASTLSAPGRDYRKLVQYEILELVDTSGTLGYASFS
jgi:hypothetical protein